MMFHFNTNIRNRAMVGCLYTGSTKVYRIAEKQVIGMFEMTNVQNNYFSIMCYIITAMNLSVHFILLIAYPILNVNTLISMKYFGFHIKFNDEKCFNFKIQRSIYIPKILISMSASFCIKCFT